MHEWIIKCSERFVWTTRPKEIVEYGKPHSSCTCVCSPWRHRQCGAVYRLRCLPNHSYVRTTHNHEWICSLYLSVPSFSHLCTLHTCSDHSMPSALKFASYAHRIPTTYVCNQQIIFFFSLFFFFRASFTKSIRYAGTDTYTHEQLYTLE